MADTMNKVLEQQRIISELKKQVMRDSLTNLLNYRAFHEFLETELHRSKRYDHPLSLLMADIDDFKKFNDTYGHKAGDEMLVALSNLLCSQIRKGDTICRYGGEEFVVMMPRATWRAAVERANQWRLAFENLHVPFEEKMLNTTLSAGIATLSPEANNIDAAMREADIALYRSKSEGRNRVTVSEKLRG